VDPAGLRSPTDEVPDTIEDVAGVKHAWGGLLMDRTVGICNASSSDSFHRHPQRQRVSVLDSGVCDFCLVWDCR
jgi:hypothetical protein